MFILRVKHKMNNPDQTETVVDRILGDVYTLIKEDTHEFDRVAKSSGWDNPKERKIFAFLFSDKVGVHPLYWTDEIYIMTSEGKTFTKLSTYPETSK